MADRILPAVTVGGGILAAFLTANLSLSRVARAGDPPDPRTPDPTSPATGPSEGVAATSPPARFELRPTASEEAGFPQAAREEAPIDGIRDNSFFVEEAYNQEPGVVQHIFGALLGIENGQDRSRTWDLAFTQEWPLFSQTHQLSYTIPYSFVDSQDQDGSGIGDVLLNYRCQVSRDEGLWPAIAPRISLILPSGDEDRGFGTGVTGYQFNLPVSKTLSDRFYVNFNAGFRHLPNARLLLSDGRRSAAKDSLSFNLAGSAIYAITRDLHAVLEAIWVPTEELEEQALSEDACVHAHRVRINEVLIAPGLRWAINLPGGAQIVPGLALPVGLSEETFDYGVFFYLSVEHPFLPRHK